MVWVCCNRVHSSSHCDTCGVGSSIRCTKCWRAGAPFFRCIHCNFRIVLLEHNWALGMPDCSLTFYEALKRGLPVLSLFGYVRHFEWNARRSGAPLPQAKSDEMWSLVKEAVARHKFGTLAERCAKIIVAQLD